jgi:aminopeptidase
MDLRIQNLAKILVHYSIRPPKGCTVAVRAGTVAEPLVVAVYEELIRGGAFPVLNLAPPGISEILLRAGRPHHFNTLTPYAKAVARTVDAVISIHAATNTRELSASNPARQAELSRTHKPIADVMRKKPWVLTLFPTAAYAQDAEMSLRDFEDFVYGATFADREKPVAAWKALARRQDTLIARLKGADQVRIVGPETDLRFSVKGRVFVNSDGRHNMPSGEIFTSPVESSVEGHIRYDFPVCHAGREIDGIRLVFRKGRVVEASAAKGEAFLRHMLDTDAGARRLGEFGIGTNTGIQRFTRNILFDEKIGGTIHLALGNAYPETGGRNRSALHWDMIRDLRRGGAIYVDGVCFQKDGAFIR